MSVDLLLQDINTLINVLEFRSEEGLCSVYCRGFVGSKRGDSVGNEANTNRCCLQTRSLSMVHIYDS